MMLLAMALAAQMPDLPPCKDGSASCKPWERNWPSREERQKGPFNLILRWGTGVPIAIHYDTSDRCAMAASELRLFGQTVMDDGTSTPPPDADLITALCIPG